MGYDIEIYRIDTENGKVFEAGIGDNPFPDEFEPFQIEESFINRDKISEDNNGTWKGHYWASEDFEGEENGLVVFLEVNGERKKIFIPDKELEEKYAFKEKVWAVKVITTNIQWNLGYCGDGKWKDEMCPFGSETKIRRFHFSDETLDDIENRVASEKRLGYLKEFRKEFRSLLEKGEKVFAHASW